MQEIINRVISDFNKRISTKIKAEQKTEDPVYKFGFHSGAEAFKEARLIIEQISQEYDMGWIPVTERLPEENQKVWVTKEYYNGDRRVETSVFINNEFEVSDYSDVICTDLVKAWKPRFVPEPYKGS